MNYRKHFLVFVFILLSNVVFCQILDFGERNNHSKDKVSIIIYFSYYLNTVSQNQETVQSVNTNSISKLKRLPKKLRNLTNGFQFINGGTLHTNDYNQSISLLNAKNSNLILASRPTNSLIESFLLSNSEITNKEYREFVYYVRDSIAHTLLALYGNPDEIGYHFILDDYGIHPPVQEVYLINWKQKIDWENEEARMVLEDPNGGIFRPEHEKHYYQSSILDCKKMVYQYSKQGDSIETKIVIYPNTRKHNAVFAKMDIDLEDYFINPQFDDYPVVGINYQQVLAYINWKNEKLSKLLKRKAYADFEGLYYRLPTAIEWQYAEFDSPNKQSYCVHNGNYQANFGLIKDENGLIVKQFEDDGYKFTAPSGSFASENSMLYNLWGNVWEWTSTVINAENQSYTLSLKRNDSIENWTYVVNSIATVDGLLKDYYQYVKENIIIINVDSTNENQVQALRANFSNSIHDYHIRNSIENARIALGGSWSDSPINLNSSFMRVFPESYSQINMGFRLVLDVPKEKLDYFLKN